MGATMSSDELTTLRTLLVQTERTSTNRLTELLAVHEAFRELDAEVEILRQQLSDVRALKTCEEGEWERLVAHRDLMLPVVNAAIDVIHVWRDGTTPIPPLIPSMNKLIEAVEIYLSKEIFK